jgi:hypothetical protein
MSAREDLLLVPNNGGYAIPDAAIHSMVRALMTTRMIVPKEERIHQGAVRLFLAPGPHAHAWFGRGTAPTVPHFHELVIAFGEKKAPLPDGSGDAWFWLELRGARSRPDGRARQEFAKLIGTQLTLRARPHDGIPDRPDADPEPVEATPIEAPSAGQCGVRVEEF